MSISTEQAVKDALRAHDGGLGPSLDAHAKQEIIEGRCNEPENSTRVDGDKFYDCAVEALKRHPVEWILK